MRATLLAPALCLAVTSSVLGVQAQEQWQSGDNTDGPPAWVTGDSPPPWVTGDSPPPWVTDGEGPVSTTATTTYSGSFSILYPTEMPTINYIDTLTFAWNASGDFASAIVECGEGDPGAVLYSSSVVNPSMTVNAFAEFGQWKASVDHISTFPITCSASVLPRGSNGADGADTAFSAAGTFVVTSSGPLDGSRSAFGASATTAVAGSTSTTVQTTTAPQSETTSGSGGGLSTAAKAGIGVGVAVGVALMAGLLFWIWRRRAAARKQQAHHEMEAGDAYPRSEIESKSPVSALTKETAVELSTGADPRAEIDSPVQPVEADPQQDHITGPFEMPGR